MWIARNFDNSLHIFENCPYLQINAKKLVKIGEVDNGHGGWLNTMEPNGEILEPFWTDYKNIYKYDAWSEGYVENVKWHEEIHPSLFSEVTLHNSPFNLKTAKFLDKEKREKQIIYN